MWKCTSFYFFFWCVNSSNLSFFFYGTENFFVKLFNAMTTMIKSESSIFVYDFKEHFYHSTKSCTPRCASVWCTWHKNWIFCNSHFIFILVCVALNFKQQHFKLHKITFHEAVKVFLPSSSSSRFEFSFHN